MKKKDGLWMARLTVMVVLPSLLLFTLGAQANPTTTAEVHRDSSMQTEPTPSTTYAEGVVSSTNTDEMEDVLIPVYFHQQKKTSQVSLEEYLKGVLVGEMPLYFGEEALKAQAVAARTYTLYRIQGTGTGEHPGGAVVCTDPGHCQAWRDPESLYSSYGQTKGELYYKKLDAAVCDTRRIVMTYEDALINALYFDNSGGWTESVQNVWGGKPLPYLQSVPSGGEAGSGSFCTLSYWEPEKLASVLQAEDSNVDVGSDVFGSIQDVVRNESGRVQTVEVGGVSFTGTQIRKLLGLRSTNFLFEELEDETILVVTFGFGHGVGMSQWGAQAMAQEGASYREILQHYYSGVTVEFWVY